MLSWPDGDLRHPNGQVALTLSAATLEPGTAWVILGENGAGKTTLLRALAGYGQPRSGWLWDQASWPARDDPKAARQRAYLPQQVTFPPHVTVARYLALAAYPSDVSTARVAADVPTIAERWSLTARLAQPLVTLSGGEQQRARLAQGDAQLAWGGARHPVWLLDEPLTGLDVNQQRVTMTHLQTRVAQGAVLVASVHDVNWAWQLGTHALMLAQGRVVWQGRHNITAWQQALPAVFGVPWQVIPHPVTGQPWWVPSV